MSFGIRWYNEETDLAGILDLAYRLAELHGELSVLTPEQAAAAIELGHLEIVIAEQSGFVIGYVSLQRRTNLAAGTDALQVTELVVHPDYRRKGIGKALIGFVARIAMQRNIPSLTLGVKAENEEALRFYATIGFQIEPTRSLRGVLRGESLRKAAQRAEEVIFSQSS
jgi:ribosomal protein S18 acetylase RimI-like enzyme